MTEKYKRKRDAKIALVVAYDDHYGTDCLNRAAQELGAKVSVRFEKDKLPQACLELVCARVSIDHGDRIVKIEGEELAVFEPGEFLADFECVE